MHITVGGEKKPHSFAVCRQSDFLLTRKVRKLSLAKGEFKIIIQEVILHIKANIAVA